MIHAGAAPVFTAGAVLITLFWAHRNRFGRADWNRLRRPVGAAGTHAANAYFVVLRKVFFWVALAAAIPAVGSAMLAMFPLLASVRQPLLFEVHRYAVATLSVSAVVFAACALGAWLCRNPENPEEPARTTRSRERV
jgi:cytochrome b subunit of formate dehydrogenase